MAFTPVPIVRKSSPKLVTTVFRDIRGVDFRQEETAYFRVPESVNYHRSATGEWETHAGFRPVGTFPVIAGESDPICYGCEKFTYYNSGVKETRVLLHAGNRLYTWNNYPANFTPDDLTCIYGSGADKLPAKILKYVVFFGRMVIKGEGLFLVYDGTTVSKAADIAVTPQTWQAKAPDASAGGNMNQRNLIQPKFTESFVATVENSILESKVATVGQTVFAVSKNIITIASVTKNGTAATYTKTGAKEITLSAATAANDIIRITYQGGDIVYKLALKELDATPVTATVDGATRAEGTHFTVNRTAGEITFLSSYYPISPGTTAVPNVYITAAKTTAGYSDMIMNCTEMLVFDNRLFLTGDKDHPNRIYWTANKELTYFGEIMYTDDAGGGSEPVASLQLLSSSMFLALKKNVQQQDGAYSVFSIKDTGIESNPKSYVGGKGNSVIGCIGKDSSLVFMDENVYLATNGFNVVSRNLNISNERNVEHRSTFVDPKLLLENLDNCVCEQYNNELYALFSDTGHVYIANAFLRTDPADTTISPYREYEWGYLSGVGVYKGQYQRFVNITGVTLNPPDSAGNETGTREGGIGTTEYIGGVFQPASTLKNMGDKELYIGMNGALYRFNFDMVRIGKENELVPAAYSFDGRFMEDYFKFTYTWMGAVNYWKKLRSGRDDLVLTTRTASSVNVTWRTEKKRFADSKVLRIVSSGCSYKYVDYRHRKYYSLPNVDISLRQLRENAFRRLQIQIGSAGVNNCVSFVSLTLEAEILKKNLK